MWLAALFLLLPLYHQVHGHNLHLRLLLLVGRPVTLPTTSHETRHRGRSATLRLAADAGWLLYIACAIAVGYLNQVGRL
jgi:hypothetical protein